MFIYTSIDLKNDKSYRFVLFYSYYDVNMQNTFLMSFFSNEKQILVYGLAKNNVLFFWIHNLYNSDRIKSINYKV